MARTNEPARISKRLRGLIEFALREGWSVVRTSGGHLKLFKAGCASIYVSSTPGDHRAERNARALLRRTARHADEGMRR
ncbi:MAG TPA: type II toxin-antitoxin system HicA family toxin [Burkholderiaceae bacterium]